MVRLIATDVDGTLLNSRHEITPRTRAAFNAARARGIAVLAVSGRQPYSIGAIVQGTALQGDVIGSNGAVAMNVDTQEILFQETLDLEAQRRIAAEMQALFTGLRLVSVRSAGNEYVAEHGYTGMEDPGDTEALWPVRHRVVGREEVLAEPSLKLVMRHDDVSPEELLAAAHRLDIPGCHPTISGAPFLEVGRGGVSKASALQRYCALHGIDRADVVAFGDNYNDLEMLDWAGLGVAMANAEAETKSTADRMTAANDDDGVARVIEELLGS